MLGAKAGFVRARSRLSSWPQPIAPIRVASEAMEEQMTQQPVHVEDDKKLLKPKADGQSHEPAKHINETARLASSVETAKDPGKVRRVS